MAAAHEPPSSTALLEHVLLHQHHHRREGQDHDRAREHALPATAWSKNVLVRFHRTSPVEGLKMQVRLLVHRVLASSGQLSKARHEAHVARWANEAVRLRRVQCAVQPHLDAHLEVFAAFHAA